MTITGRKKAPKTSELANEAWGLRLLETLFSRRYRRLSRNLSIAFITKYDKTFAPTLLKKSIKISIDYHLLPYHNSGSDRR